MDQLILQLHDIGAIKFGSITLKTGITSPIYIDLRLIISYPKILKEVADLMWEKAKELKFDLICGVPYTALPIATALSLDHNIPMCMRRKEVKEHGTRKALEGVYQEGQTCLMIEDLITSGASVLETTEVLEKEGLICRDVVLLIDREQGGKANLKKKGMTAHSLFTITDLLATLQRHGRITQAQVDQTQAFLAQNRKVAPKRKRLPYGERADLTSNPTAKALFQTIQRKRSNLSFNADVRQKAELLRLVDLVGPHICLLKTHIDLIEDFDDELPKQLQALADKHDFLIFEDRKFADIGQIVAGQYSSGVYKISEWAHVTNAHMVPGPGIIEGLKTIGLPKGRGLLLLAEMSSKGSLAQGAYTQQTVAQAKQHKDFVIGFVSNRRLTEDPEFLHLTPGVKLQPGSDSLGQQYRTPDLVIREWGSDVIQVGRGIAQADDPAATAKAYRDAGWEAYEASLC